MRGGQHSVRTVTVDLIGVLIKVGSKIAESIITDLWADVREYVSVIWWPHGGWLQLSWDRPQVGLLPVLEQFLVRRFGDLRRAPMFSYHPYARVIFGTPTKRSERTPRRTIDRCALLLIPV